MKQKMRIKLSMNSDKCRKKAMQVAVVANGVTSVAIEGEFKDELVVVGDGVDAACLIIALRKKACYATLETLEEMKPHKKPQVEDKSVTPHCCIAQCPSVNYNQPMREVHKVVYDSYGPTGCLIM